MQLTRPKFVMAALVTAALAIQSLSAGGAQAQLLPPLLPSAPASVQLAPSPTAATTLTVTWTPPADGSLPPFYGIWLYDGAGLVGASWCLHPTCRSEQLPGLTPGRVYWVAVRSGGSTGWSLPTSSTWYVMPPNCADAATMCATVDGNTAVEPAAHVAQGFLHAPIGASEVEALKPTWYRVGGSLGEYSQFDMAEATGAQTVFLVSDAWAAETYTPLRNGALPPWQDFPRYREFVRTFVGDMLASGRNPDYWEVQNEPGRPLYLNAVDTLGWNTARYLEQFKIAYEEIIALDPDAKVIGPSLDTYNVTPNLYGTQYPDIRTFLDFAVANGIRPGAITWHEFQADRYKTDLNIQPIDIVYHVEEVRALLAERGMADVPIYIGEYAIPETHLMPGWSAGFITALEAADVEGASRSCWTATWLDGLKYHECLFGLNALLGYDDTTKLGNYWVHRYYAEMVGDRVATKSSTAKLSVLSARDADGVIRTMIGRHEHCTLGLFRGCGARGGSAPMPAPVMLDVLVPGEVASARVTVSRIPFSGGPLVAPIKISETTVPVVNGKVAVRINNVCNGDAFTVTVAPIS